jgi:hypothetical protein
MPINPIPQPVDVIINPSGEPPKIKDFIINAPLIVQSTNVKNKLDSLDSTSENLSQRVAVLETRPIATASGPSGDYVPTSRTINSYALTTDITITKSDLGLANVDNTSDINKPVSTLQAAADAVVLASANAYTDAHGGGSLPTATAAGQTLISAGAGTTYTAVNFGSQVSSSLGVTPSFDTGNGWTIVDTTGTVGSFPGGGIARFTCTSTPVQHDLLSGRIERPFAYDGAYRYFVKVRPRAASITGALYPSMFIRNATNIFQFVWVYPLNQVLAGQWEGGNGLQPPGFVNQTFLLDGTDSFCFRIDGYSLFFYCVGTSKRPVSVYTHQLNFVPTHIGVNANSDGGSGIIDFSDFTITTY